MTVVPLDRIAPVAGDDAPLGAAPSAVEAPGGDAFARALRAAFAGAGAALERADAAEHAFATRHGGLQEMVLERARADVVLSLASAAATRTAQALSTILGMQV
jgi:flagellar hook-basal body complex protein FliE